jgi:protease I
MSTIAVLIDDLFEDSEYAVPADSFMDAGHRLVHIGLRRGSFVVGKNDEETVAIDEAVDDARPDVYDALFIPGGYSPDRLRAHRQAVDFVRDFTRSDKPVLTICHGPQLLISAQVVRGRRITGWRSILQDLRNAGAEVVDEQVVEDGNIISSREPGDLHAFVKVALRKLSNPDRPAIASETQSAPPHAPARSR